MKVVVYMACLLFLLLACPAQAQTSVYRGVVSVKENKVEQEGNKLTLDIEISVCGLSVGRYQTLTLMPMLRAGRDSLLLQPIVLNGANKQKMYERILAFKGKTVADDGAYVVLKNDPLLIQQIDYKKIIPYRPWMKGSQLVLVGLLNNYEGGTEQTFVNVLTGELKF